MHQNYHNALDLLALAEKIEKSGASSPSGRYLFDKILHPSKISSSVLLRSELSVLICARPPRPTISSILTGGYGGITTVPAATDYYLSRLQQLQSAIEQRKGKVLFMDADAIIEIPEETLNKVSEYLHLTPAIKAEYRTFPLTGRGKIGDQSKWIMSGQIEPVRDTHILPDESPDLVETDRAYAKFRAYALRNAECSIRCGA